MTARASKTAEAPAETPEAPVEVPSLARMAEDAEARRKAMNVHQRMLIAQRVIDGMPWVKDMSNAQYKSIPIDAMRAGVRKACIEAGLVHVGPLDLDYKVELKDGRIKVYTGTCIFRYINIDDSSDYIDYPSLGEAMDTGDKGAGKLISNLIKTHYKTCFDIGEQGKDDIDSYSNEDMLAEADRIAARREANRAKAQEDRFFKDPLAPLRRQVGQLINAHGPAFQKAKAEYGPVPEWTEVQLKAFIDECAKEGGQ